MPPSFGRLVARTTSNPLFRNGLIYTSASLVTSALNYLYYPVMGHLIPLAEYGELQVVVSFILQLSMITIGLNLINVNLVANFDERENVSLMVALQKLAFWFSVAICVTIALS